MFNLFNQTVQHIMNKKTVDDDKARKEQSTTNTNHTYYEASSLPQYKDGETDEEFLTRNFKDIFGG